VARLLLLTLLRCDDATKAGCLSSWLRPSAADRGEALMVGALVRTSSAGLLLPGSKALQVTTSHTQIA
jgi:hypothetical protein